MTNKLTQKRWFEPTLRGSPISQCARFLRINWLVRKIGVICHGTSERAGMSFIDLENRRNFEDNACPVEFVLNSKKWTYAS